ATARTPADTRFSTAILTHRVRCGLERTSWRRSCAGRLPPEPTLLHRARRKVADGSRTLDLTPRLPRCEAPSSESSCRRSWAPIAAAALDARRRHRQGGVRRALTRGRLGVVAHGVGPASSTTLYPTAGSRPGFRYECRRSPWKTTTSPAASSNVCPPA